MRAREESPFLLPREAAGLLGVTTRTLSGWAKAGLLSYLETPGGHRRYRRPDVLSLARALEREATLGHATALTPAPSGPRSAIENGSAPAHGGG